MSLLMESEAWPLSGQFFESSSSITWDRSSAANVGMVDDYDIASSLASFLPDYGDDPYDCGGSEYVKMDLDNCVMTSVQHIDDVLPVSPENVEFTHSQMKETIPLLYGIDIMNPISGHGFQLPEYAMQSSLEQKFTLAELLSSSLPSATQLVAFEGATFMGVENLSTTSYFEDNVMDMLNQLCDTVDGDMIISHAQLAAFDSILPPMSPDDIDSFLSSGSPDVDFCIMSASSSSSSLYSPTVISTPPSSPASSIISSTSELVSSAGPPVEKRMRKMEQNKTAALRYRHKKRNEHGSVMEEHDELEKRNIELKSKVSEMEKEVDYLKGLIAEICA